MAIMTEILGQSSSSPGPTGYKVSVRPRGKCEACPLFDDTVSWCNWYKIKVENSEYNPECMVRRIDIEE